jgi:hypothetical protein
MGSMLFILLISCGDLERFQVFFWAAYWYKKCQWKKKKTCSTNYKSKLCKVVVHGGNLGKYLKPSP